MPARRSASPSTLRGRRSPLLTFVAVMDVPLTGLAVHEWLGVIIGVATGVHLVQHGSWILTTGKRLFASTSFMNRLNYIMMSLLFAAIAAIIVSGMVISEVALPLVGVVPIGGDFWLWLHVSSVVATALHIAVNWHWTICALERYVATPVIRMARRAL